MRPNKSLHWLSTIFLVLGLILSSSIVQTPTPVSAASINADNQTQSVYADNPCDRRDRHGNLKDEKACQDSRNHSGSQRTTPTVQQPSQQTTSNVTTQDALTITTTQLLTGMVGVPYAYQFTWTGGVGSQRTWTITGLPAGMTANSSLGTIQDNPTQSGNFTVHVIAKDEANNTATKDLTLTIRARPSSFSPTALTPDEMMTRCTTPCFYEWFQQVNGDPTGVYVDASATGGRLSLSLPKGWRYDFTPKDQCQANPWPNRGLIVTTDNFVLTGFCAAVVWKQTTTPTPPPPATCPAIHPQVRKTGPDRLEITVASPSAYKSLLLRIEDNTRVQDVRGTGDYQISPGGPTGELFLKDQFRQNTTSVIFTLVKLSGNSATIRMKITNQCGDWETFAGAGPAVFGQ